VVGHTFVGLQALALKAQYEAASGNAAAQESTLNALKSLVSSSAGTSVGMTTAQVLLATGQQTKEAFQLVHSGSKLEEVLLCLQIQLKLDRLDLARKSLSLLKSMDEDSVVCQLGSVYVNLASGSDGAADALHTINSLTEQYGTSSMLANLQACALMQQGDYAGAQVALDEALNESTGVALPDTLVNLICAATQQNIPADQYIGMMQERYPSHPFCVGLERVVAAFDREAVKYKV
jgi:coatomer subunit epsilon